MMIRRLWTAFCALALTLTLTSAADAGTGPGVGHVFIIVLENEGYDATFGSGSSADFLRDLAKQGALLQNYYAIGHASLDNYIAMISGQAPNPATQGDCPNFTAFASEGVTPDGQAIGSGCVYPADIPTIANQMEAKGLRWKAYMEDMGADPARESAHCGHPAIGEPDKTQRAVIGDQYAARHDPFVYFHAIIDRPSCQTNVVGLDALAPDLGSVETTPNLIFISPNLCHDGHDGGGKRTCVDGEPGGLKSADQFLKTLVPVILASPAFRRDGLLIVTFDEADLETSYDAQTKTATLRGGDASACCHEQPGPNISAARFVFGASDQGPGIVGPGGGRIGAALISPLIKPGVISTAPYNHYALLKSIEDMFGLAHLGYAGQPGLNGFGAEIFSAPSR